MKKILALLLVAVMLKRFDANSRGKHKPGGIQGNKMANK